MSRRALRTTARVEAAVVNDHEGVAPALQMGARDVFDLVNL